MEQLLCRNTDMDLKVLAISGTVRNIIYVKSKMEYIQSRIAQWCKTLIVF